MILIGGKGKIKDAPHIVTVSVNPSVDKSTEVEHVVAEHKLRCERPQWQAGGGGINAARVIQRLGGSPLVIYLAGGPLGQMVRNFLDEEGIAQEIVAIAGETKESFAVRETATNRQFRFSVPGPDISEAEWQECLARLHDLEPAPDYLVLSGGLPPGVPDDFYSKAAEWGRQQGSRVIVDTHDEPLRQAVESGVFLLKPNLRELRQLTGQKLEGENEQRKALRRLIDEGKAEYVVLSLGAGGALFASAEDTEWLRAPTVPINSKIGAGDSMVGGIVWALAQNYSPSEAARFGVAAGAATVKTPGTELCHPEDVMALYEQIR